MANVLSTDKQITVIGALAEGSGIRQIERMMGVHRDTIMRLGVHVGHESQNPEREYSAPEIVATEKKIVAGSPDMALVSTSYIERLNGTTRLHMRRRTSTTIGGAN